MIIQPKVPDGKLLEYIYDAAEKYKEIMELPFLFAGKNRNTGYMWFECIFEKKQFMHLLGIKSKNYTAEGFFDRCDEYNRSKQDMAITDGQGTGITIKDCTPSRNHSRTTINEKASVCSEILQIHNAKYLKIGEKDKISQHVDFSYAYGSDVTLGFKKDKKGLSFPITLIPRNIDTFTTKSYRILFVFTKTGKTEKYDTLYAETKTGLFDELYCDFPEKLKNLIDIKQTPQ